MLCPRPWLGAVVGLEKPSVFTSPPLLLAGDFSYQALGSGGWSLDHEEQSSPPGGRGPCSFFLLAWGLSEGRRR